MAGNPYGPLYNSVQARGRMSPGIGAPGALMPKDKKPGLGSSKMASALCFHDRPVYGRRCITKRPSTEERVS